MVRERQYGNGRDSAENPPQKNKGIDFFSSVWMQQNHPVNAAAIGGRVRKQSVSRACSAAQHSQQKTDHAHSHGCGGRDQ
jgi:hypothetical protein